MLTNGFRGPSGGVGLVSLAPKVVNECIFAVVAFLAGSAVPLECCSGSCGGSRGLVGEHLLGEYLRGQRREGGYSSFEIVAAVAESEVEESYFF